MIILWVWYHAWMLENTLSLIFFFLFFSSFFSSLPFIIHIFFFYKYLLTFYLSYTYSNNRSIDQSNRSTDQPNRSTESTIRIDRSINRLKDQSNRSTESTNQIDQPSRSIASTNRIERSTDQNTKINWPIEQSITDQSINGPTNQLDLSCMSCTCIIIPLQRKSSKIFKIVYHCLCVIDMLLDLIIKEGKPN